MTDRRTLLLAGVAACCLVGLRPAQAETAPEFVIGSPDAPVTMVEYASLTCPHCASFHNETLPKLKEKYIDTGKVKLIYRDFPLDEAALTAAILARCAGPERGPTFLSAFFQSQDRWAVAEDPQASLRQLAKVGGLSDERIDACLADKELGDSILQMRLDAEQEHSIQSTPSFLINGKLYAGNAGIDGFTEILEPLVN
ncbi:DsbA family protein [Geminicoccus roseus]|uniref:DsbA family protein n=1 Tax=Geminicoccus roseus TaxID=404900 RepID=UPI0003FFF176|nr:DsbA family protein [Geminicoccus roseus]